MLSRVYRQVSSRAGADNQGPHLAASLATRAASAADSVPDSVSPDPHAIDPANRLLWRQRLRRLESEAIRDAVLATSGQLDPALGGPPSPVKSEADGSIVLSDKQPPAASPPLRRSLYVLARRNYNLSMLGVFDQPVMTTNCTRRNSSAVVLQSLAMLNDRFVIEQAEHFADVVALVPADAWVTTAFRRALVRGPTAAEAGWCQELLDSQYQRLRPQAADDAVARRAALAHLCHMLLNTSEFLYVH